MTSTFYAFLVLADLPGAESVSTEVEEATEPTVEGSAIPISHPNQAVTGLHYKHT